MGTGNISYLLNHFSDVIWAIHPDRLKVMSDILLSKVKSIDESLNFIQLVQDKKISNDNPYIERVVTNDGKRISILNIEGTLVPKASSLDALCGMVSTIKSHNLFNSLVDDPSVDQIVLYFDSPGGADTGVYEFAESIYQAREKKDIVAYTDVCMTSGAYWLASAATVIVSTPSSIIGSIGAYMALMKRNESNMSVKYIYAGDNKIMGAEETPMTDEEINYFQNRINNLYERFVTQVAKYRNVSLEEVKNTKGSYYNSVDAPKWMADVLADSNFILS